MLLRYLFKTLHLCSVKKVDATCLVIKKTSVIIHGSYSLLRLKHKKKKAARTCFLRGKNTKHALLFNEQWSMTPLFTEQWNMHHVHTCACVVIPQTKRRGWVTDHVQLQTRFSSNLSLSSKTITHSSLPMSQVSQECYRSPMEIFA